MANADMVKLAVRHRENSYSTQRGRRAIVKMMAEQLGEMGFMRLKAKNLKEKHALALIERWRSESLSAGTLKNRMGVLRWVYEKVNKSWMLEKRNADYGIDNRRYQTNVSKARELNPESLARIKSEHVRLSLEMQRTFGLRREEAMKIQVAWADRGNYLKLKGSWTKGGRERTIPIRTEAQRELLDRVESADGGQVSDSREVVLRRAHEAVRKPDSGGRPGEAARLAARLRSGAVQGDYGLGRAGRRRAVECRAHKGRKEG